MRARKSSVYREEFSRIHVNLLVHLGRPMSYPSCPSFSSSFMVQYPLPNPSLCCPGFQMSMKPRRPLPLPALASQCPSLGRSHLQYARIDRWRFSLSQLPTTGNQARPPRLKIRPDLQLHRQRECAYFEDSTEKRKRFMNVWKSQRNCEPLQTPIMRRRLYAGDLAPCGLLPFLWRGGSFSMLRLPSWFERKAKGSALVSLP